MYNLVVSLNFWWFTFWWWIIEPREIGLYKDPWIKYYINIKFYMVSQCLIQNTKNLFLLYNINVKIYMVCQCLIYKILRKKQSEKKQHSEIEVIEISRMVFSLLLFSGKERTSALSTEAKLPSGLEILRFGRDLSWNFIRKKQEGESPSPWCMFLQQVLFFLRYFFF